MVTGLVQPFSLGRGNDADHARALHLRNGPFSRRLYRGAERALVYRE
jgi:hypothetical protein